MRLFSQSGTVTRLWQHIRNSKPTSQNYQSGLSAMRFGQLICFYSTEGPSTYPELRITGLFLWSHFLNRGEGSGKFKATPQNMYTWPQGSLESIWEFWEGVVQQTFHPQRKTSQHVDLPHTARASWTIQNKQDENTLLVKNIVPSPQKNTYSFQDNKENNSDLFLFHIGPI